MLTSQVRRRRPDEALEALSRPPSERSIQQDPRRKVPAEASATAAMIAGAFRPQEAKPKCAACERATRLGLPQECATCGKAKASEAPEKKDANGELLVSGGDEPDRDEAAEQKPCALAEVVREIFEDRASGPSEAGWMNATDTADRPLEAGWWTGRTPTSNTIGCDGGGNLSVMQNGSTYEHGVTDCTIAHEQIHVNDWLTRYGNDICKKRAKGDLPNFDPAGADSYSAFLKKSECSAWKVGEACRKKKLAACKTDECKTYVQPHVEFAGKMVKKYCG